MNAPGMRTLKKLSWALAASSLLSVNAFADVGGVPQASINLSGATLSYCNTSENQWTITKTSNAPLVDGVPTITSGDSITWTVTATKNGSSTPVAQPNAYICAEGTITIANGGQAPATLGNIVVNLQKNALVSGKNRWVSAAADVATAASGDGATSANIVAAASAEAQAWNCVSPNATACNYTVVGARGTFTETTGISGALQFTDADNNAAWSISPPVSILVGAPVTLKYKAVFLNKVFDNASPPNVVGGLKLADGAALRTEIIVSFGNAGGRGGSGASASGIDINGDGDSTNDGNVRSVPVRLTSNVPALVNCNASITLEDVLTTTGSVVYGDNSGALPTGLVSDSNTWTVTTPNVTGNGSISNTVDFVGSPNQSDDACCKTDEGSASATVLVVEPDCQVNCNPPPPHCDAQHLDLCPPTGAYCTYTQGGYGGPGGPYQYLQSGFTAAFGSSLVVGTGPTLTFTSPTAVQDFLPQGGPAGSLTVSMVNPPAPTHGKDGTDNTTGAGVFGGQVTALTISLGLQPALGALMVNTSQGSMSMSQILAIASSALSGGDPAPFTLSELNGLVTNLNESFDNCVISPWALGGGISF